MDSLRDAFDAAAQGDELVSPGTSGLYVMLSGEEPKVTELSLEKMYAAKSWSSSKSFKWHEIQDLFGTLKEALEAEDVVVPTFDLKSCGDEWSEVVTGRASSAQEGQKNGTGETRVGGEGGEDGTGGGLFVAETDEGGELARMVDLVQQRLQKKEFPLVKPEEAQNPIAAEATLSLARKLEAVEIQSFLDKERALFVGSDTGCLNTYFAQNSFYYHLRQFLFQKSLREKKLAHCIFDGLFIPLIPVSSVENEELHELALQVAPRVMQAHLAPMEASFWQQWRDIEETYLPYAEQPAATIFEDFMLDTYFETFKKIISDMSAKARPKVAVDVNASQEDILVRQKIFSQLSADDVKVLEEHIRSRWSQKKSQLPPHVRAKFPGEPSQKFWEEHYYPLMLSLYGHIKSTTIQRTSQCPLNWDHPDSPEPKVCELPNSVVVATSSAHLALPFVDLAIAENRVFGMDALLDGTAFDHIMEVQTSSYAEFLCSKALLEESVIGGTWQYEGWLLQNQDEPRTVKVPDYSKSPSKRKAEDADKIEKEILDVVLIDDTGPVLVTLWGDCVSRFFSSLRSSTERARKLVHLSAVSISKLKEDDWNGKCLSNIRVLSTMEARGKSLGTVLTFVNEPSSPFIGQVPLSVPNASACIASFLEWKPKFTAPFRATFVGTVANSRETSASIRGNAKKFFDLVDSSGYWFICCAVGQIATNKALNDGARIMLFYGLGRKSLHDSPGAVFLLQDAVVIQIGRVETPVVKRSQLEIS